MIFKTWTHSKDIWSWLPRVQSHRGYWVDGTRENTLAAIQKSYSLGYEMVEFDVRLDRDQTVILFHDAEFEKTPVQHFTLKDLRKKTEVTTLEELFSWIATGKISLKLNIELKTDKVFEGALERKVVSLIHRYQLQNQVLISSFNPIALARVKSLDSKIFRALLLTFENHPRNKWYLKRRVFNIFAKPHMLNLDFRDYSEKEFEKIRAQVPVVLWTVNDLSALKNYQLTVFGIITDSLRPTQWSN